MNNIEAIHNLIDQKFAIQAEIEQLTKKIARIQEAIDLLDTPAFWRYGVFYRIYQSFTRDAL